MSLAMPHSGAWRLASWGGPRPVDRFDRLRRLYRRSLRLLLSLALALFVGFGAAGWLAWLPR